MSGFRTGVVIVIGIATALFLGCAPGSESPRSTGEAPPSSVRQDLDRLAAEEESRTPTRVRILPLPESIARLSETDSVAPGDATDLDSIVRRFENPRVARVIPESSPDLRDTPASRELTRAYVRGRDAYVRGEFEVAIVELEGAARAGGGAASVRLLADALDGAGRDVDALAIRREMARQGWLDRSSRVRLLEGLRRRELMDEAIAVSAAGVLSASDERERLSSALDLVAVLQSAELLEAAATLREVLLRDHEGDLDRLAVQAPGAVAAVWRRAGDVAALRGEVAIADARWRRGFGIDPGSEEWGDRLAWSAACLGRDAVVATIVLEGARRPGFVSIDLIPRLREAGVDLAPVARILSQELEIQPTRTHTARVLAACDPELASRVFAALAARDGGRGIAGPLVAAAVPAGVEATWNAARSLGREPESMDVVVDQVLAGPWNPGELLPLLWSEVDPNGRPSPDSSVAAVAAETLRRHALPVSALDLLEAVEEESVATRVVEIRSYADLLDPLGVDGVDLAPFDPRVEEARVIGLLDTGEPELALRRIDEALVEAPGDPRLLGTRGRVLGRFRGRTDEALAALQSAWRDGDRRVATRLEIVTLLGRLDQSAESDLDALAGWRRELIADPSLRRLLEADQALALGDHSEAERLIRPLVEDPEWRDIAIPRLLAAWRAGGRLAVGRSVIEKMVEARPCDPVLGDALFALDRVLEGPRAVAAGLRAERDAGASGLPVRRLELVLAEIPESRTEWRRLVDDRLDRSPVGPVTRLARVETGLDSSPSEADSLAGLLEVIDLEELTPRLRRRLVSIASAIPADTGHDVVARILRWHRESDVPLDVDTVVAAIRSLGVSAGIEAFEGLEAVPPLTLQDPTWASRLLAPDVLKGLGVEASAAGLQFAVAALEPDTSPVRTIRSAVAAAMAAGAEENVVLELVERARDRGWPLMEAWELPEDDSQDERIPFMEIASDASLLGREDVSIALLRAKIERDPDDSIAMNNLGYALLEADRLSEAGPLIVRSFELDPLNPSTLDSLGWLRYRQGRNDPDDPEGALSLIERSIRLRQIEGRGTSSEVLLHRGDAAWRAGRRTAAVADWSAISEAGFGRSDQRRRAALDAYQMDAWGGVLVDSAGIDHQLEGRWLEMALARLAALERDEPPPVTPLWKSAEAAEGSVQSSGD